MGTTQESAHGKTKNGRTTQGLSAKGRTKDVALAGTTPRESASDSLLPNWIYDDDDLVAIGGDLNLDRLLAAYRQGIFPWYEDGSPILWWSPDPRAILELDQLHVSRRLARKIRNGKYRISTDRCFTRVMESCAGDREEGTWITAEMIDAYTALHAAGHAHSVEIWLDKHLVGGLYGVSIGGFFAGESMFYRASDASKIALVALVEKLRDGGFDLFDIQILNEHTRGLGAVEISREAYLKRLQKATKLETSF